MTRKMNLLLNTTNISDSARKFRIVWVTHQWRIVTCMKSFSFLENTSLTRTIVTATLIFQSFLTNQGIYGVTSVSTCKSSICLMNFIRLIT
jgi:hypothetical protein